MNIYRLVGQCKQYIWGGTRLATQYNKHSNGDIIAESWELSTHPDGISMLAEGGLLTDIVNSASMGSHCSSFDTLPMLVKLIDAQQNLSIQVHPDDSYAMRNEGGYGKTEMWYIADATPDAGIYLGFSKDMTVQQISDAVANNTLTQYLHYIPVRAGQHYWIDSGTVHAICSGCVICEVQQNSNITYRLYDYQRTDSSGNMRPLHVSKALDVIHTPAYTDNTISVDTDNGKLIGTCQYFTVHVATVACHMQLHVDDTSFVYVVCLEGSGSIEGAPIAKGDSYFVPASYGTVQLCGNMQILTARV